MKSFFAALKNREHKYGLYFALKMVRKLYLFLKIFSNIFGFLETLGIPWLDYGSIT
jgi:hypothetical protein